MVYGTRPSGHSWLRDMTAFWASTARPFWEKSKKNISMNDINVYGERMNELNWWINHRVLFPRSRRFVHPLDVTLEDPLRRVVPVVQVILVHIVANQVSPVLGKKEKEKISQGNKNSLSGEQLPVRVWSTDTAHTPGPFLACHINTKCFRLTQSVSD